MRNIFIAIVAVLMAAGVVYAADDWDNTLTRLRLNEMNRMSNMAATTIVPQQQIQQTSVTGVTSVTENQGALDLEKLKRDSLGKPKQLVVESKANAKVGKTGKESSATRQSLSTKATSFNRGGGQILNKGTPGSYQTWTKTSSATSSGGTTTNFESLLNKRTIGK